MELEQVAAELYGQPPEDFTAVRNERAKEARGQGDRALATAIQKLRKPSTAAWAVNLLAREAPEELDQLLSLGAELREAAEALDGEELRELTRRRHQVVAALARQVRGLAREQGRPLSDAIADEVEETLRAALADPDAAEAVRAGQLTNALSSTGLGPVELSSAVAVPAPARQERVPRRKENQRRDEARDAREAARRAEARAAAEEAEQRVRRARERLETAEREVDARGARRAELAEEAEELARRLRELESEAHAAEQEERGARGEREAAQREVDAAEREERRAQVRLDRLR